MPEYFAGIGSRRTPEPILEEMTSLAEQLAELGYILRSGAAPGADTAFEQGYWQAGYLDKTEIYIPWAGFNGYTGRSIEVAGPIYEAMACKFHPLGERLRERPSILKIMCRNVGQVLGRHGPHGWSPSKFVLCWTPDGSLDGHGPNTGGTGQALRITHAYHIPVINMARPGWMDSLKKIEPRI